jgi:Flp pilus assembly protein TadG
MFFRNRSRFNLRGLQGGQAATEFALLASLLMLALVVAVEIGRLGYLSMTLDDAARAGAQYGAQNITTDNDLSGMTSAATNDAANITGATWWGSSSGFSTTASNYCQCSDGTTVTCGSGSCSTGTPAIYVKVVVQANYHPLINYPGLPSQFTIKEQAVMRVPQ